MKFFVEEIKLNGKEYFYTLLWYITLIGIAYLFLDSIVTEFFDNIYRFMVLIFFSGSFGRVPAMQSERTMYVYAKLPITIKELYSMRIVKAYLLASFLMILLLIFSIWDNRALSFETILFILIFVNFTSIFWVYHDVKFITESKGIFRRIIYTVAGAIVLIIPLAGYVVILKSNEYLTDNILLNIGTLIAYIIYCSFITFYIFKLRKNYKY